MAILIPAPRLPRQGDVAGARKGRAHRPAPRRWAAPLLGAALLLGAGAPSARAQGQDRSGPTEYEVKAAFLYNFTSFVEWPESALPANGFVIGVLGRDPFGDVLDAIIEGEQRAGHGLGARRYRTAEEAKAAQVLFISTSESARLPAILEELEGHPVLTVGESPGFARRGGMVQFRMDDGRVRFEIDEAAAERAGLRISSHLLKLAIQVHPASGPDDER